ncbi:MAG: PHP domain-containing protein [Christensenellales bacterium]
MAQQWEGLLEGAAQELKGHLTLERVTASKAGDEIAVFFSSDMLVEEKPFLAAQRAIRRNFAPTRVKLIIRSPQLAQDFLNDPQKYAPFILRCVKRRHPSGAPFMNDAKLECKGDVLSVLVPQDIAPKFRQSGVDHYIEQLIENVCDEGACRLSGGEAAREQLEEIRRRRKAEDEQAVAQMIKTQSEQVAAQETKPPRKAEGRLRTADHRRAAAYQRIDGRASKLTICGEVLTVETRELRGGEMQLLSFALTDYTNTIKCKAFLRYKPRKGRFGGASQEEDDRPPTEEEKKAVDDVIAAVKEGKWFAVRGDVKMDSFEHGLVMMVNDIDGREKPMRQDTAERKRIELHMHTNMSEMDAVSSASDLIKRAAQWGHPAVAITDHGVVQAFPEAFGAAKRTRSSSFRAWRVI